MAFNTLDPVAALVVIDVQKGIMALETVHPAAQITARAAQLARAFRQCDLPVVLVNVAGVAPGRTDQKLNFSPPPGWSELVPELDAQPDDHRITKLQWGAFHGTSLDQLLRRRAVTQIVLAGVATSIGVESTARAAHELGYNVVLVHDAMTDRDAASHRHSVEVIFPRLGELATTAEILAALRP
jgi:nicotinamidase-related amidase